MKMVKLQMETLTFVLACHLAFLWPCNAKVAVFFSVPAVSHIRYHTDMARALAKYGHEVWVCLPDFLKGSDKIDMTGVKALDYGKILGNLEQRLIDERHIQEDFWEGHTFTPYDFFQLLLFTLQAMDDTLKEGFYEKVKAVKPDLFIIDAIPVMRTMLVVPYKLGIQSAFAGAHHDVINARVPFSPVATPSFALGYSNQMIFMERLHTTILYVIEFIAFRVVERDIVGKYAPEMPYLSPSDLAANASLFLAETDPILDYPMPMLPNTKLIGGATVQDAKPLNEPYKSFVEKSKHGIIVVTFGSAILNVPDKIFQKMMAAFSRLEASVVWRVNGSSPDKNKVWTDSWIPQNDLLGQPKTKLFVSHCGKSGQYEALHHAIPILCLPVFGDQNYNAERVVVKGYGLRADIRDITVDELTDVLKELLMNTTYKNNIAKASRIFQLLYKSPMQEAAFWLDHVLVYGGDYMKASSQTMPLYQFLMLDILAFVSFVIASFIFILCFFVWCCCRICGKGKPPKAKRE